MIIYTPTYHFKLYDVFEKRRYFEKCVLLIQWKSVGAYVVIPALVFIINKVLTNKNNTKKYICV